MVPTALLVLLLTAVVVVVIWLQARWAEEDELTPTEKEAPERDARIEHEVRRLASAEAQDVREASNHLLALGPRVLPYLCARLRTADDGPGGAVVTRGQHAVIEDLVASFGLHAAQPVARSLRRVVFPSPMLGAALRVVLRLGSPAYGGLLAGIEPENVAGLGLVLHRCPGLPEPHVLRALPEMDPARAWRALQIFGGALERHPGPVVGLFDGAARGLRTALVEHYASFPTPVAAEILVRAVDDQDPRLRVAGALGIGLLAAEAPAPLRAALDDPAPAVRQAALRACGALSPEGVVEAVAARVAGGPPEERAAAALALASSGAVAAGVATAAEALRRALADDDPRVALAAGAALAALGEGPGPGPAILAMDAGSAELRRAAAEALAVHAPFDVRARERMFLVADGDDPVARACACAGLAACDLRDLPSLLSRVTTRHTGEALERFHLRQAVRRTGGAAIPALLLLVRTGRPHAALLAAELVASTGDEAGLDGLLRSLPHRRGDLTGMVVRSHAAAFGPRALDRAGAMLADEGGITVTALCEFLAQYGDAARHSDVLIDVLGRSEAHRTPAAAALECFAAAGPQGVLSALDRRRGVAGGDWLRERLGLS